MVVGGIWGECWCASRVCAITINICYCGWCCVERCKRRIIIIERHFCTLMNENLEDLRARFQRWRSALEGKGLKINNEKTKMMVSGTENAIALSKIVPCGICGKRAVCNTVFCTLWYKWMHGKCTKMIRVTCSFARHFILKGAKILEKARKNQWRYYAME